MHWAAYYPFCKYSVARAPDKDTRPYITLPMLVPRVQSYCVSVVHGSQHPVSRGATELKVEGRRLAVTFTEPRRGFPELNLGDHEA